MTEPVAGRDRPRDGAEHRFWLLLGLVVVAGLIVRVGFLLLVDPPVGGLSDARAYHLLGVHLAEGRGYIRPYDFVLFDAVVPTAEYPPLFPGLLGLVSLLGIDSIDGQRLVLCVVGSTTVGVVGVAARQLAGAAVGLVAAAIAAGYPMLFQAEAALMPETLAALGGALAVWAALVARRSVRWQAWGVLGAVLGASILARGGALVLLPLLVVPLAWRLAGASAGRRLALGGLTVAVAAAVVLPWTVRNWIAFHAFVPVSNNTGSVLRGANCDLAYSGEFLGVWVTGIALADQRSRVDPDDECFDGFEIAEGEDEADAAARERAAGLDYVGDHLGEVPGVMAVRWLRAFGLYEVDQQTGFEALEGRNRSTQRVGTAIFHVLAVAALAGALVCWRRRRALWPLLAPVVAVSITVVLTYGNQRFRALAEPAVVVLAAVALVAAAAWVRQRLSSADEREPRMTG